MSVGKTKKLATHGVDSENRMQKDTAKMTAFANRSIPLRTRFLAAQNDLARVLYRQHVPPGYASRRVPGRFLAQARHSHRGVTQKPPKPDLATRLATCQSENARSR